MYCVGSGVDVGDSSKEICREDHYTNIAVRMRFNHYDTNGERLHLEAKFSDSLSTDVQTKKLLQ